MALSGEEALALAKSYTQRTAEGTGAVKGKDGFSPIVTKKELDDGATVISITDSEHTETVLIKNGEGIPPGGKTGQVLVKCGDGDYEAEWKDRDGSVGGIDCIKIQCTL